MNLPSSGEPPTSPPDPSGGTPFKYRPRPTDDEIAPKRWGLKLSVFGLIIAVIVLVVVVRNRLPVAPEEKTTSQETAVPEAHFLSVSRWTEDPGMSTSPAYSPNGKLVAYASDRENAGNLAIWLRRYPSGSSPWRLTREPFNATDPDFSPDNNQIVYHSDRDGGGIYIVPVSGKAEPRLLAAGGLRPRFSPDGRWIAYYAASKDGETARPAGRMLHIVAPTGGAPRRIRPDFSDARDPVWFPRGEVLLFEGTNADGVADWWVTPIDGGAATRTNAFKTLNSVLKVHTAPLRWDHDKILFSGTENENLNLWELGIEDEGWQASGSLRALTQGGGMAGSADVGPDGRIIFAKTQLSINLWSLPLDAGSRMSTGPLQPIIKEHALAVTDERVLNLVPTVRSNGTKLVFLSNRTGWGDVWIHDLKSGNEYAATSFGQIAYRPVISPDETRVAYRTKLAGDHCVIMVTRLDQDDRKQVAEGCFDIWDWSPDGASLLVYESADPGSVHVLKIGSHLLRPLISHRTFVLTDASFSPDGKWVAFSAVVSGGKPEVFVARYHDGPLKEAEWIPVSRGNGSISAWSPDSSVLYFHSERDGFHCIWAQKLNAAKQPVGDPIPILHLHSVSFGLHMMKSNDFHMAATKDRLILNIAAETANLWISQKR